MRLGWFLSSAFLKVKIKTGMVAFLEWDFQTVAAVGVAEALAAAEEATDITAHLGGTAFSRRATRRKPHKDELEFGYFHPHARTCPSEIDADVSGGRIDRPISYPKSRNSGHRLIQKKSFRPHGVGGLDKFCHRVGSPLSSRLQGLGEIGLQRAKEAR